MSAINLNMVVEVDAKQLEAMREKMDKLDAQLLEKLEKVSISMRKLLEKLGYTLRTFIEFVGKGFGAICSKLSELKELLIQMILCAI